MPPHDADMFRPLDRKRDLARLTAAPLNPAEVLAHGLEVICGALDSDRGVILEADPDGAGLRQAAAFGDEATPALRAAAEAAFRGADASGPSLDLATSKHFDDEVGWEVIQPEVATYFANIVLHLGGPVLKALDAAKGLELDMIGPSHGVIWRKEIPKIVASYYSWARGAAQPKVLIIYDTMWGSTEKMAKAILEGVQEEGVLVKLMNITSTGRTVIMKEVLDAKALIIGSPTLNNGMYPTVAEFLCYMKGLKPQGKLGAVFGSYGWGGGATKAITEELQATGVELIEPPLQFPFLPAREELEQCKALGKKIASRVKTQP